jgi:hypothetical protein
MNVQKKKTVHYGIRPSGRPHLGNALTAVFACNLLDKMPGEGNKKLLITINDWDRCSSSVSVKELEVLFGFLIQIMKTMRLEIISSSDIFKRERGKKLIQSACEQAKEVFAILERSCNGVPIFPMDQNTGEYAFASQYAEGYVNAISKDPSGRKSHFRYIIGSDVPIEMPVELKLALKHAVLKDEVDVFVLGGNYGFTLEKIKRIGELFGVDNTYELGPIVFSGSRVMSKSRGNIIALEDLLLQYSPNRIYNALLKSINTINAIQAADILNELAHQVDYDPDSRIIPAK